MQPVIYRRRRSAIPGAEREWRVDDDALVTCGGRGREARLPWRDVQSVRLYADPTRVRPWRYVFEIQTKQGRRIQLDNGHFLQRGSFEDRSATYTPFVHAALSRIAAHNPKARALMGETQRRYFFFLLVALICFCALALALIWAPTPLDASPFVSLAKLGIVLIMLPVFARWVLGSIPRGVALDAIPPRALPCVQPPQDGLGGGA